MGWSLWILQKVINHLFSSLFWESSMKFYFCFPVSKRTITGICGIGNFEFWKVLVGKEPRKIISERKEGTPEFLMGVVPSFRFLIYSPFFEKVFPSLIPFFQSFWEDFFVCFCKSERKKPKFFSSKKFWFPRDVLGNRLDLMKLEKLNGNKWVFLLQKVPHAPSSVYDKGRENKPRSLKTLKYFSVVLNFFSSNLFPKEILLLSSCYEYSIAPPKEGGVYANAKRTGTRNNLSSTWTMRIKVFPKCPNRLSMFLRKLIQALLSRRIFMICPRNP